MPSPRAWPLAAALLLSACVDNGSGEPVDVTTCEPLVKFSVPEGVTPQADNGVVSLPVELSECALDANALWAWTSDGDLDQAVDVYESEDGAGWLVIVPVAEAYTEACESSTVTVALVDDRGDVVDQDRTHIGYAIGR